MSAAIAVTGARRLPRLRAVCSAWLRAQRVAVASTALYRNQLVVCASAPLTFAPERRPAPAPFIA